MSIVDHSNATLSQKKQYADSLINASENQLVPDSPTVKNSVYSCPIKVIDTKTGLPANISMTRQEVQNMEAELVRSLKVVSVPSDITDIQAGGFTLNLNLTSVQVDEMRSSAYVSLISGSIREVNAPAVGKISGSNLPASFTSIRDVISYMAYLESTSNGRVLYLVLVLSGIAYYITMIYRRNEKKARRR